MKKICFCTLLLLLFPAIYGQQDNFDATTDRTERIIRFQSDIVVDTTGMIRVAESIRVYAGGKDIQRGIVRSIPIYRTDVHGKKKKMTINIISVSRNGQKENYKTEKAGENIEIYIGNPDVYLMPGIYDYIITYESPGQIGFFDTHDEIYWNVTGHDWVFPIEGASASIRLPEGVESLSASCYTGSYGSTEMNCSSEEAGNSVYFATVQSLAPHENLSVEVSFPRDSIKRPPPPSRLEVWWEKYKYPVSALLCWLIAGIFFFFSWRKVGKDPEKPIVIPMFNPPQGRSPAATRYLYKRRYDDKVFTAALVGMAVKKAIRISHKDGQYTLEPIERTANLSAEETAIYDSLFPDNKSLTVTDKNHKTFADANTHLTEALQSSWNLKDYFLKNLKQVALGTVLILALLTFYVFAIAKEAGPSFVFFFTVPFIGLASLLLAMNKFGKGCLAFLSKFLGLLVFGILSFFVSLVALGLAVTMLKDNWITGVFILVLLISYGVYVYLIKAPTPLGAQTASELEGFKMYLKTAEEHRLNLLTPPEKTPELFEKLLPYAIALDVENEWGQKFTEVLKQFNYNPDWYRGDKPFTSSKFPSTFARSFTSSVGSARINPAASSSGGSWSSGSHGGGFSGGGGGGGGGRGW